MRLQIFQQSFVAQRCLFSTLFERAQIFGIFAQDHWRLSSDLSLSFGLRYDYDTDGNNPDCDDSPLVGPRSVDSDNIQPRFGFTWDIGGKGESVFRGGAGIFTGRYLLVPLFTELHKNGDMVLAIDGAVVTSFRELEHAVQKPEVKVTVWRNNSVLEKKVRTAALEEAGAALCRRHAGVARSLPPLLAAVVCASAAARSVSPCPRRDASREFPRRLPPPPSQRSGRASISYAVFCLKKC